MNGKDLGVLIGSLAAVAGIAYLSKGSKSKTETTDLDERRRRNAARAAIAEASHQIDDRIYDWNEHVAAFKNEVENNPNPPDAGLMRTLVGGTMVQNHFVASQYPRIAGYDHMIDLPETVDLDPEEIQASLAAASTSAQDAFDITLSLGRDKIFKRIPGFEADGEKHEAILGDAARDAAMSAAKLAELAGVFAELRGEHDESSHLNYVGSKMRAKASSPMMKKFR